VKTNSAIITSKNEIKRGMFILPSKDGLTITKFENNPEEGYLVLMQNKPKLVALFSGTQLKMQSSTCLLKGAVDMLEFMVEEWSEAGKIPGNIITSEFLEKDLPISLYTEDGDLKAYAENLRKVAGDTGVTCKLGGQDIFRMKSYTADLTITDTLIAHDNAAEITAAQRAAKQPITANNNFDAKSEDVTENANL
jgi:hypothetical protein